MITADPSPCKLRPVLLAVLLPAVAALVLPTAAAAQGHEGWAFSAGIYDTAAEERPFELGVEYRFAPFRLWFLDLEPAVGASATDEGNAWVYLSFRYDVPLGERWMITPQTGVSLYEAGDGKDLGGVVEFRSGLEVSYGLRDGSRLGLLFYHLSNADIYTDNPGSNSLVITWSLGR